MSCEACPKCVSEDIEILSSEYNLDLALFRYRCFDCGHRWAEVEEDKGGGKRRTED